MGLKYSTLGIGYKYHATILTFQWKVSIPCLLHIHNFLLFTITGSLTLLENATSYTKTEAFLQLQHKSEKENNHTQKTNKYLLSFLIVAVFLFITVYTLLCLCFVHKGDNKMKER